MECENKKEKQNIEKPPTDIKKFRNFGKLKPSFFLTSPKVSFPHPRATPTSMGFDGVPAPLVGVPKEK